MFSKEWKLVAVLLATVTCLAACAKDKKKKTNSVPFAGLWVNQKADRQLFELAAINHPEFCSVVFSNPEHYGISIGLGGLPTLDAWQIKPSGDVYLHNSMSNVPAAQYKEYYYAGRVTAVGEYSDRYNSNGAYGYVDSGAMSGEPADHACFRSPFVTGASGLELQGGFLKVGAYGRRAVRYVKADSARLRRINNALLECAQQLRTPPAACGGSARAMIQASPRSAHLPPAPGHFQPRPPGPRILEND